MKFRILILCLSGVLATQSNASPLLGPGLDDLDREIGSIGPTNRFLNYELFRPPGYEAESTLPLVVFLHGFTDGQPENNQRQLHPTIHDIIHTTQRENVFRIGNTPAAALADEEFASFFLVPKIPVRDGWTSYDELTLQLIDDITQRYVVDDRRIYLAGFSNGGFATVRLLGQYSDKFAAGVSVAGGAFVTPERVDALSKSPLWLVHDLQDSVVQASLSTDLFDALSEVGAPVNGSFPNGVYDHGSWSLAFRRNTPVFPWMFSQSLPVPEPNSLIFAVLAATWSLGVELRGSRAS